MLEKDQFPLRYLVVGGVTYLLDSGLYAVFLREWPRNWYPGAYVSAGVIAFACNFCAHRLFTFKGVHPRPFAEQFFFDFALKMSFLAFRTLLLYLSVEQFGLHPLAGIAINGVMMALTFTGTSWILGGSNPKKTWLLLWGYVVYGWGYVSFARWVLKEEFRVLKTRFGFR